MSEEELRVAGIDPEADSELLQAEKFTFSDMDLVHTLGEKFKQELSSLNVGKPKGKRSASKS